VLTDVVLADGDRLYLNEDLWTGVLSAMAVMDAFASVIGEIVVFDFGDGDRITLQGVTSLAELAAIIDIW
jgi:hypothetical protein